MSKRRLLLNVACKLCLVALASSTILGGSQAKDVTPAVGADAQNWYTGGRDLGGTYFSPLTQINTANVDRLGFAWQFALDGMRGQEATPIVIDGVMYTSGSWGYVYSVDAATGRKRWRYDPKPVFQAARNACCDLVNRGVAVHNGIVYVVSIDGRLHAIDAASGRKLWDADTIVDHTLPYASTGAPQVAGNVVVIGNSGSDMGRGGIRGYVSAYDLRSGGFRWRFYTVPPPVGAPYENPELEAADATWDAHRPAQFKGGGSAWDGFAYDPALNLVYFGTANAAPYDLRLLGPSHGDALYTASIIALHADTGRMAWYYQTTPEDHWDYDATQKLVLSTLKIGGADRDVLMQASKNGFFYVLDRKTGELLSAKNYTYVNWTNGVDSKTGRPATAAASDWHATPRIVYPSWAGGHTWNPMAFNPMSGLVYLPAVDAGSVWVDMAHNGGPVTYSNGTFTANTILVDSSYDAGELSALYGPMPDLTTLGPLGQPPETREVLRAWDPIKQKVAWEHVTSAGFRGYDGGTMTTAANLVFQGQGNGDLVAYAADTGRKLTALHTGSHIMAAPMTYSVRGQQYVAVQVGYGGTGVGVSFPPSSAAARFQNINRIIAFRIGNRDVPTPPPRVEEPFPAPPPSIGSAAAVARGKIKFYEDCAACHAFGPNITADLRKLPLGLHAMFKDIVLKGVLASRGMERFDDLLTEEDVDAIHAFLIEESRKAYAAQRSTVDTQQQ